MTQTLQHKLKVSVISILNIFPILPFHPLVQYDFFFFKEEGLFLLPYSDRKEPSNKKNRTGRTGGIFENISVAHTAAASDIAHNFYTTKWQSKHSEQIHNRTTYFLYSTSYNPLEAYEEKWLNGPLYA